MEKLLQSAKENMGFLLVCVAVFAGLFVAGVSAVALDFKAKGAKYVHIVDLEGAKEGSTPNFDTVCAIKKRSGLFCEIGGGIRGMDTVERYLCAGIDRVILGTAAIEDEAFQDCTNLKKVVFLGKKPKIADDAFKNCPNLDPATLE